MLYLFTVTVAEGYSAEQYAEAWVEASRIIQRSTGARGTFLHRDLDDPRRLLAIATWESKAARDAAETANAEEVRRIIDAEARHVRIRVVGEFGDPAWEVVPES